MMNITTGIAVSSRKEEDDKKIDSVDTDESSHSGGVGVVSLGSSSEGENPDEENQMMKQRFPIGKEMEQKCNWKRYICGGAILSIALVALVLSLSLCSSDGSSETAPAPTYEEIVEMLSATSLDEGEALTNSTSPQSQAAMWLAGNDDLSEFSAERMTQRYALATLYYSTNGDEWTDKQQWLSDSHECSDWWIKQEDDPETTALIECNEEEAITSIKIENNNLFGTLPDEITFLSDSLVKLDLKQNRLYGTLSSKIGLLTRLKDLVLRSNDLQGTLPTELGLLTALENLRLFSNTFTSTIPTEISFMTSLNDLRFSRNNLNGTIPSTAIGSLTSLDTFWLSENQLTGSIPSTIGLMISMRKFRLQENKLTGR